MTNEDERAFVERIKNSYEEKEETSLAKLKRLHKKVKTPAIVFAYIFGSLGTLILGVGMCLAMKVIGDLMPLGIVIGVIGIIMVSICYPIYQKMLARRKARYANQIIEKSNELLNKEN